MKYYLDYVWERGIPQGIGAVSKSLNSLSEAYKIVSDPYHRRISIEKYRNGSFEEQIYDSALFDFRWLKPVEQTAWNSELIAEDNQSAIRLIRNQDDRIVAREHYHFEGGVCRLCEAFHPSGLRISTQRIYYKSLGDPLNGVVLLDCASRPVVFKEYEYDEETQEFTTLIKEQWDVRRDNLAVLSLS